MRGYSPSLPNISLINQLAGADIIHPFLKNQRDLNVGYFAVGKFIDDDDNFDRQIFYRQPAGFVFGFEPIDPVYGGHLRPNIGNEKGQNRVFIRVIKISVGGHVAAVEA